jgi:hypothetical protein
MNPPIAERRRTDSEITDVPVKYRGQAIVRLAQSALPLRPPLAITKYDTEVVFGTYFRAHMWTLQ